MSPLKDRTDEASFISKNKTAMIAAVILLLVALMAGFALGDGTRSNSTSGTTAADSEQTPEMNGNVAEEVESSVNRPSKPIQTVKTNTPNVEMQLDTVIRRDNTVTVNVSYVFTKNGFTPDNPSYKNKLQDAYLVDNTTNQKYSVVTDENGNPLVSDIDLEEEFEFVGYNDKGSTLGFYVTLTAPAAGAEVDIFIPGSQALTGIKLN